MNRLAVHPRARYLHRMLVGRLTRSDDSGASLIIALIVITVVALVTGTVLFLSDSSIRTTVQLRNQASVQYQASNGINTAIEQMRSAAPSDLTLGCGPQPALPPAAPPAPVPLLQDVAYPAVGTAPGGSFSVTCQIDNSLWQSGLISQPNAGPGTALLALGGAITIDTNQYQGTVTIDGGIFANDQLLVTNSKATVKDVWPSGYDDVAPNAKSWILARNGGNCANVTLAAGSSRFDVNCNVGNTADLRGIDPGVLVPAGSTTYTEPAVSGTSTVYSCGSAQADPNTVTVTPGVVDADALNKLNTLSLGTCQIVHFLPGTYYFSGIWNPVPGYYVAGSWAPGFDYQTFKAPSGNNPKDISGACINPLAANGTVNTGASANSGVEFVFGSGGGLVPNAQGNPGVQMNICASPAVGLGGPPIAIFGSKSGTPSGSVFDSANCPKCIVSIQGTVYAPTRDFNIYMNNGSAKSVAYGLIAGTIEIGLNSSVGSNQISLAGGLPQGGGSPAPLNYEVLRAFVCPGQATCGTSGSAQLSAKVAISGYLDRSVSVISWAPSS